MTTKVDKHAFFRAAPWSKLHSDNQAPFGEDSTKKLPEQPPFTPGLPKTPGTLPGIGDALQQRWGGIESLLKQGKSVPPHILQEYQMYKKNPEKYLEKLLDPKEQKAAQTLEDLRSFFPDGIEDKRGLLGAGIATLQKDWVAADKDSFRAFSDKGVSKTGKDDSKAERASRRDAYKGLP